MIYPPQVPLSTKIVYLVSIVAQIILSLFMASHVTLSFNAFDILS